MYVNVENNGTTVTLTCPYNTGIINRAKPMGGSWNGASWQFDARDEDRVRDLAREIFGTDGCAADAADLVTVRIKLKDFADYQHATFAGRRIAERPGRDQGVRFADGVVVVEGRVPSSGGSMKNPALAIDYNVIAEIRDIPRAALSVVNPGTYAITGEQADIAALAAERKRLAARIAEIDTLLAAP